MVQYMSIYFVVINRTLKLNLLSWCCGFRKEDLKKKLRPDASSKGTIVMGNVHPSVSNWCPNDNLRTKGRIESRCGMYVYLVNT
jgi:hypothetical protein